MKEVTGTIRDGSPVIALSGRIDSGNAPQAEAAIQAFLAEHDGSDLVIDAEDLEYISSAGLRVLLRMRKSHSGMRIINAGTEVYEILDMTGFTQMMTVERAYRVISIEGCEVIGQGANGTIYRIDGDNVVKVYNNAEALDEIQHEREVARLALVLGIPTAISYDVVRVGDSYGSVFELLDARSFSLILEEQPEKMDWCVKEYVDLLKKIHRTEVRRGDLPDMRETAIGWAQYLKDYLPAEAAEKLEKLIRDIPEDQHMLHGDYHTKNIQLTGDEVLLIDMDTLAVGHPVFELASMYNAFIGFGEFDHDRVTRFMGFDYKVAAEFWHRSLEAYLNTGDEATITQVENKARVIGYARMIRRSIRRGGMDDPDKKAEIEMWTKELLGLLETEDSLVFTVNLDAENDDDEKDGSEIELEATRDNLPKVMAFVEEHLQQINCPMKAEMQIAVAVEEIFINIANYAYGPDKGNATVRVEVQEDPVAVVITFIDQGVPYDPVAKADPDVTLSAEEREIGGLGIFMVKQTMDDVHYEYQDGKNILTLKKEL
ncbi:MAG: anti-sigma factor antagonist [Firmicutes bacterium]|nr:anti-sigma factor antagonist [Bacillota bacterium]